MVRLSLDRAIDHMNHPIPLPYSVQPDLKRFLKENPPKREEAVPVGAWCGAMQRQFQSRGLPVMASQRVARARPDDRLRRGIQYAAASRFNHYGLLEYWIPPPRG